MIAMKSGRGGLPAVLCLLSIVGWSTSAPAAGDADAAKGLVVEHCVECHAVPGYGAESLATLDAPAFDAIAAAPETYTAARLRAFLQKPHWPMGQFRLSPNDIENILAFIKTTRPAPGQ